MAAGEEDFYAVAAAGVALGVEGLVDVAYEVDDELGEVLVRGVQVKGGMEGGGGYLGSYCALVGIESWIHESGCLRLLATTSSGDEEDIHNSQSPTQYRNHPRNPSLYPTHSSTAEYHPHRYNADALSTVHPWCTDTSPPRWRLTLDTLALPGYRGSSACTAQSVERRGARRGRQLSCDLAIPMRGRRVEQGGERGGGVRVSLLRMVATALHCDVRVVVLLCMEYVVDGRHEDVG